MIHGHDKFQPVECLTEPDPVGVIPKRIAFHHQQSFDITGLDVFQQVFDGRFRLVYQYRPIRIGTGKGKQDTCRRLQPRSEPRTVGKGVVVDDVRAANNGGPSALCK